MKIQYTSKFWRQYKKLPAEAKQMFSVKKQIFEQNPFDPKLKTHKLHGRLEEYWAFYIAYDLRIVFKFINSDEVIFHSINDHNGYKMLFRLLF